MKKEKHYNRWNNRRLLEQLRGANKDFLTLRFLKGHDMGERTLENVMNPSWRKKYWAVFNAIMDSIDYGNESMDYLNNYLIPFFVKEGVIY